MRKVLRVVAYAAVPAELVVLGCLVGGAHVPAGVVAVTEAMVACLLVAEAVAVGGLYRRARREGGGRSAAVREAMRTAVPPLVRRLIVHEARAVASLALWLARRRDGVRRSDHAADYAAAQASTMFLLVFAALIETAVLAVLIPWPAVHLLLLLLDGYGVLFVVALHASCVVRPHVIRADGSLRVRYGALFDLYVPADLVAAARVDRRYPEGRIIVVDGDGRLDVAVGGLTSVTVELTRPITVVRPLGRRAKARVLHFHADDPRAAVAAITQGTARQVPEPDSPG
ncbi:hypothetical protein [Streptomyces sp. 7N604]|uniref:hypothetical protein n=1 Tax=Streptomyces sp. 7N604 TaxID=3457415 RepID=UPI003FD2F608